MNGHAPGTMPPEYTGGLGSEGALALKQFVDEGGTLVALDSSSELAIAALGLPRRDVVQNARPEQFFVPGSILRLTLDPTQPLDFGMPAETAAFFAFSSAFAVQSATSASGETATAPPSAHIVASYATNALLMSGWLEGEPAHRRPRRRRRSTVRAGPRGADRLPRAASRAVSRDVPPAVQRAAHCGTSLAPHPLRDTLERVITQFLRRLMGGDRAETAAQSVRVSA